MGYYINTTEVNFVIPADKVQAAYEAVCELNNHNELKGGGSYPRSEAVGADPSYWFSWMDWNYPETCKTLEEVMEELGFSENLIDNNGNFHLGCYDGKTGDEEKFIKALAPFAEEGSYVSFCGEDNDFWRFVVIDGEIQRKYAEIVYR